MRMVSCAALLVWNSLVSSHVVAFRPQRVSHVEAASSSATTDEVTCHQLRWQQRLEFLMLNADGGADPALEVPEPIRDFIKRHSLETFIANVSTERPR